MSKAAKVEFGVDQLLRNVPAELRRDRVGMVTSNAATIAMSGELSRVALRKAGVNLVKLFGPEHGLAGTAADGARVGDDIDHATGLSVVSLYGERVRPSREALEDIHVALYDIPDVGARFYTYIWTLSHVMEACAEFGKPLYVLDRPNPIGGDLDAVEGPMLDERNLSSFVGRWNIPIRYSLAIGELATLWNAERSIGCDLRVIKTSGWRRNMHWPATGLRFIPTSPNLPSYESALFYPGTCLLEGTNVSEGRGSASPFRIIGAPWIDADALSQSLQRLPAISVRAVTFIPEGRKYAGERCNGVELTTTDPKSLRPVATGLQLIAALTRLHRDQFQWLPYPTAANNAGLQHFDRLIGQLDVRSGLDRGGLRIEQWTQSPGWKQRVTPHLLYE